MTAKYIQTNNNIELLQELFDAKLDPLQSDIRSIKLALYGNGKKGLLDRTATLEFNQKSIMGKVGLLSAFFGLIFTAAFEVLQSVIRKHLGL